MPEVILSDYFYGDESEEFVFFKIPRQLITNPKFKHVSTDAKLNRIIRLSEATKDVCDRVDDNSLPLSIASASASTISWCLSFGPLI